MKLSGRGIFLSIVAGLMVVFSTAGIGSADRHIDIRTFGHSVKQNYLKANENEILVEYKSGTAGITKKSTKKMVGVERTVKRIGRQGNQDIYVYKMKPGMSAKQAVDKLRRNKDVLVAQVNYRRRLTFTPNDPMFNQQWGLLNTGQAVGLSGPGLPGADIDAVNAWNFEQGYSSSVTVAVIDTGIDLNHPDLSGKLWKNEGEIPNNDIDDDLNGYVDDFNGYNFAGISDVYYNWIRPFGSMDYQIAQSIKGTGRPLTYVGVGLLRVGLPDYGVIVGVRESLDGPNLSTAVVKPNDVPEYSPTIEVPEIGKNLSAPVRLTAGKTYYITLETTATDINNYYQVSDTGEPEGYDFYKDGIEHWKIGDTWLDMPNYDLTFRTNDNAVPRDDYGHGTHVSGIIGAATNNAIGIAGVSPGARIMSLKGSGAEGLFYSDDLIEAIHYAADNGAKVINMSLGGPSYGVLEQMAVYYAVSKGVTVVAAAGNDGNASVNYPAGYDFVIGVGATDNADLPAGFSNYNSSVDFTAPGVDVLSTLPTYPVALSSMYDLNYDYLSGTSMATPFTAGLVSLIAAKQPTANCTQMERILERGVDDLGAPWRDVYFGYGRINSYKSLMYLLLKTELTPAPNDPDGDNGWYASTPTIALNVNQAGAASYYTWDTTSSPLTTYTLPFRPTAQGTHTLYYFSTLDGATETVRNWAVKLDIEKPNDPLVSSGSHTTGIVSVDRTVDINLADASDAISGVEGYAISWTKDGTENPAAVMTTPVTVNSLTGPALSDGDWWLNLRTKDYAGNWTSTVHMGPFVIDGPPVTSKLVAPPTPDGENGWYKTKPLITLSPNEVAAVYYQLDSMSAGGWIGDSLTDAWVNVAVPDGRHIVYYFSVDTSGNTETVKNTSFMKVDSPAPTGAIIIADGAVKTKTRSVSLKMSAADAGSGTSQMRFKNEAGGWTVWEAYAAIKSWNLTAGDGNKTVFVQFKDTAGNTSAITADSIELKADQTAPTAKVRSPRISTNISKRRSFRVRWSAVDPWPSSGISRYDVKYKIGLHGVWKYWLGNTARKAKIFKGRPGRTYYFKVRAVDNSNNIGVWSAVRRTIVPYDQKRLIVKKVGFEGAYANRKSKLFLGTVKYSTHAKDKIVYRFYGKSVTLISTKGPNRSKAAIKIDGKFVRKIDAYSSAIKYRRRLFRKSWSKKGRHYLKITNLGTSGRPLFDIDGLAVER